MSIPAFTFSPIFRTDNGTRSPFSILTFAPSGKQPDDDDGGGGVVVLNFKFKYIIKKDCLQLVQ